jgi:hypothetical protein
MRVKIKTKYIDEECEIVKTRYSNGRIGLLLDTPAGEPVAVATVNLSDEPLEDGYTFIKDYSQNEGLLKALQDAGIVGPIVDIVSTGYVNAYTVKVLI